MKIRDAIYYLTTKFKILRNGFGVNSLLAFGNYSLGNTYTMSGNFTDYHYIICDFGFDTINAEGGGHHRVLLPTVDLTSSQYGCTYTLNGNVLNTTLQFTSPNKVKVLYAYNYTTKAVDTGSSLRQIYGILPKSIFGGYNPCNFNAFGTLKGVAICG